MKPVGAAVHLRRGTVNLDLVKWLCIGSVPAAFCGVFVLRLLGDGEDLAAAVKKALGAALLVASAALIVRAWMVPRRAVDPRWRGPGGGDEPAGRRPQDPHRRSRVPSPASSSA